MAQPATDPAGSSRPAPLASVIIPAHNESTTIARCLHALTGGDPEHSAFEIIVACNGCTDDTVAIARSVSERITVLDIARPGKTNALRMAEAAAATMPRLYLDADITFTERAAKDVADALRDGAIAARPPITFDLTGASWLVRRFWAARQRLDNVMSDLCGGGAYGLSETARSRFDEFPEITSDDLFVARHVAPDEVSVIDTDPLIVLTPRTTRAQFKVLKRVYRGNQEFAAAFPSVARETTSSTLGLVLKQARNWRYTLDAVVYIGFAVAARVAIRFDRAPARWERDDSAR
jgi:glycosyltransferase involved in cell wall biosynthesis